MSDKKPVEVSVPTFVKIPADFNDWDQARREDWCKKVWVEFTRQETPD